MVAIIKSSGSLRNILHYNENKLKQHSALLIHSMNYGKDTDILNFSDKLKTLEKLTELNQRTRLNAVHISLNFDPSEKLETHTLQKISEAYMEKIGFSNQPFLVYQHYDSGHPHIHIVTTNIQRNGSRIPMQNIGRNQSENARQEIEQAFQLIQAKSKHHTLTHAFTPRNALKLQYGKADTRRAITNILDAVLPVYKYASLPELNAVLRQYNVIADRGGEYSRTFKKNGLVYRVLDEKGNKTGTPVKASLIYNNPGLKYLEEKFARNGSLKQRHKLRVKNAIDRYFVQNKGQSLETMVIELRKEQIQTVLRTNDQGIVFGITYVDHQSKCVFNGSDLGKQYSAHMILKRCNPWQVSNHGQILSAANPLKPYVKPSSPQEIIQSAETDNVPRHPSLADIANTLTRSEYEGYLPAEFRKKQIQKRKRKRPLG